MTKDEALKMAIEALEIMGETYPYRPPCLDWEDKVRANNRKNKALNACKEALATNEESLLVQPAQEPVSDTLICASKILTYLGYSQSESNEPSADKRRDKIAEIIANFYTPPAPAKEWVGLSDEEMDKIFCEVSDNCINYFPSELNVAWFKALKEKNHATNI